MSPTLSSPHLPSAQAISSGGQSASPMHLNLGSAASQVTDRITLEIWTAHSFRKPLNCIIFLKTYHAHQDRILNSSLYFFRLVSFVNDWRELEQGVFHILPDFIFVIHVSIYSDKNASLHSFRYPTPLIVGDMRPHIFQMK